jgi:predicted N-acetyltransferase YhbS
MLSAAGDACGSGVCMIDIRIERPEDVSQVRVINKKAFEKPAEANVVDKLRRDCPGCISLVASQYNLSCQWEGVPDEAFMVLILEDIAMDGISGEIRYRDEFNEAI